MEENKNNMEDNNKKIYNALDIKIKNQFTTIQVVAMRNYGKSVLTTNLLVNLLKNDDFESFNKIIVFSKTSAITGQYKAFVKNKNVYQPDEAESVIENLIKEQKKRLAKKKKLLNVIVVFDDVPLGHRIDVVNDLFAMGRHYHICLIFLAQYSQTFATNPLVRGNTFHYFIGEIQSTPLEVLFSNMRTRFKKFKDFEEYYDANIKKPLFLWYSLEDEPEDRVKIVEAEILKKIKVINK